MNRYDVWLFYLSLIYQGYHDYKYNKLDIPVLLLMIVLTISHIIYNYTYITLINLLIIIITLPILFISIMILSVIKNKIYIYMMDIYVIALVFLINIDTIVYVMYYTLFIPLAFIVLKYKMKLNTNIPFVTIISITVIITLSIIYLLGYINNYILEKYNISISD
jgi:hypothetical protein